MTLLEAQAVIARRPEGFSDEALSQINSQIKRVVILKTSWYADVIDAMEASALEYLSASNIPKQSVEVYKIPGSFELPLAVLQSLPADFVVALGCIVKGDTPHFDFVCQAVTQGLMNLQLSTKTPIGFGVLTVNEIDQALVRGSKGAEAAQAAYFMYLHGQRNKEV